ncbi:MAG: alpha/beta hydrolase [Hyphomicrobiales bacterium]|nr:alpha/beta hydrolase [Hyphomicrobiales bacterium]
MMASRANDDRERTVAVGARGLEGQFALPVAARGVVIFAHGSGSSRFSPRNGLVADGLRDRGFATLLFDLLTRTEAEDRRNVFDVPLLAGRVREAVVWARQGTDVAALPIGLFGASTGAAAALVAAADAPDDVAAVVSRGGRPDLAADALGEVRAPTLLIVGGADTGVIELNEAALARLACTRQLEIVPGATHLFEEPGALETVVDLAGDWFATHFSTASNKPTNR